MKINTQELINLYSIEKLPLKDIAKHFNKSIGTISYYLKKLKLDKRKREDINQLETLTFDERNCIIGSILGTGNIETRNQKYYFFYRTTHEKTFLLKKEKLKKFIKNSAKNNSTGYYFRTLSFKELGNLKEINAEDINIKVLYYWLLDSNPYLLPPYQFETRILSLNYKEIFKKLGLSIIDIKNLKEKINIKVRDIKNLIKPDPILITSNKISKTEIIDEYQGKKKFFTEEKTYNLGTNIDLLMDELYIDGFPAQAVKKNELDNLLKSNLIAKDNSLYHNTNYLTIPNSFMEHRLKYTSRRNPFTAWDWFWKPQKLRQALNKEKNYRTKANKSLLLTKSSIRSLMLKRGETPGNFSPSVAKYIFTKYKGDSNHPIILDFCAGFGGRLFGAWGTKGPLTYIGIEPNTETYNGLVNLKQYLENQWDSLESPNKIDLINSPMEDVDYTRYENKIDLIFTSPPYFDTEKYGGEDTQSYKRYPTYSEWKGKFLKELVNIAWKILKENGILAISLKNTKNYAIYDDLKLICEGYNFSLIKEYDLCMGNPGYQKGNKGKRFEKIGIWGKK